MGGGIPKIDVIMPAFNAARWLDDFMRSLLDQDFADWRLIARDDGSGDATSHRLEGWRSRIGARMLILHDNLGNVGVRRGTNLLLAATSAPWIMLADPDDVWIAGKMSQSVDEIRRAEAEHGVANPIAIFTDAVVVDSELRLIHNSFWMSAHTLRQRKYSLRAISMENPALSSTMIMNRALAERAYPLPDDAAYQDWWFALVAAGFGTLRAVPTATVLYRRHDENLTEMALGFWSALLMAVSAPANMRERLRGELQKTVKQATAFTARFKNEMSPADDRALGALSDILSLTWPQKRYLIFRYGFWYSSISRNLRLLAFL